MNAAPKGLKAVKMENTHTTYQILGTKATIYYSKHKKNRNNLFLIQKNIHEQLTQSMVERELNSLSNPLVYAPVPVDIGFKNLNS